MSAPQMRGTWPGMTQRIRDCLAPDGHRQIPICPLCAKQLLHAQREHQRLEAAARRQPATAVRPPEQRPNRGVNTVHPTGSIL